MESSVHIQNLARDDEQSVTELLRHNLEMFDERKDILVSTFRRIRNLYESYTREGCHFLVAKDESTTPHKVVACVGVGSLHGLPSSEGLGEVRDLVVDTNFRGQGIGRMLVDRAIATAKFLGYRRLYLETTKSMQVAQQLFVNLGFRPITDQTALYILGEYDKSKQEKEIPSYFILENL